MSRTPRPMYVTKTTVYLTEAQKRACKKIVDIIDDLPERGTELSCRNDAIGYALIETLKQMEREKAVKK